MFAKLINYSLNKIGYELNKVKKNYSFDHIYTKYLKQNCSIIDVGANEGQSVKRFLSLFRGIGLGLVAYEYQIICAGRPPKKCAKNALKCARMC